MEVEVRRDRPEINEKLTTTPFRSKKREREGIRERMKYKKDRPNSVLDIDSEIGIMKISESAFPFPSDD